MRCFLGSRPLIMLDRYLFLNWLQSGQTENLKVELLINLIYECVVCVFDFQDQDALHFCHRFHSLQRRPQVTDIAALHEPLPPQPVRHCHPVCRQYHSGLWHVSQLCSTPHAPTPPQHTQTYITHYTNPYCSILYATAVQSAITFGTMVHESAVFTQTHMHTRMHACTHARMHTHTHKHKYTHINTHTTHYTNPYHSNLYAHAIQSAVSFGITIHAYAVFTQTQTHVHTRTHAHIHKHKHTHVNTHTTQYTNPYRSNLYAHAIQLAVSFGITIHASAVFTQTQTHARTQTHTQTHTHRYTHIPRFKWTLTTMTHAPLPSSVSAISFRTMTHVCCVHLPLPLWGVRTRLCIHAHMHTRTHRYPCLHTQTHTHACMHTCTVIITIKISIPYKVLSGETNLSAYMHTGTCTPSIFPQPPSFLPSREVSEKNLFTTGCFVFAVTNCFQHWASEPGCPQMEQCPMSLPWYVHDALWFCRFMNTVRYVCTWHFFFSRRFTSLVFCRFMRSL